MKKEKNSRKEINTDVIPNVSALDSKELSRIFGGGTLYWRNGHFVYKPTI
jgi:uncharacterized protein with PIN domain